MHHLDKKWIFVAFDLLLAVGAAIAQFTTETQLVVLHASVTDKRGRLVTNLQKDHFKVFENGILQKLKLFRHEDVPVSMGLLIDNSGSMRGKRTHVEAAALALARASNPQDEVFIVNFNDEAYLDVPFTNDIHNMEQGLTRIDSRGGTAMRDAINMSINYITPNAKKDKKVLIVITDGNDNASSISLERLTQRTIQTEVLVYAIGVLGDVRRGEARKAKRALKELAKASGGSVSFPEDVNEVQELAVGIAHDVRSQYTLAYSPQLPADGSYRQIKVVVDAPGSPAVRTRSGYYAKPEGRRRINALRKGSTPRIGAGL